MKQEVFNHERAEIAAFAPYAVISEIDDVVVMDIPVQATDRSSTYQFRAVWDETDDGEVAGIRVYALAPSYVIYDHPSSSQHEERPEYWVHPFGTKQFETRPRPR